MTFPIARSAIVLLTSLGLFPFVFAQSPVCEQGTSAFRAREWSIAADSFAACEKAQPGQTTALLFLGKALINLNRFDDAASAFRQYLVQHPQSDDALSTLAYVRFRQDQPRESLQLFNQAVQLKPPTADDLKIVALDYVLLRDYNDAAQYLEQSLKLDPENVDARYHLGRARYQLNQFDLAIAAFQEVLRRDPANVKAEDNLGLSYEAKNEIENAMASYRRAIELERASQIRNQQPYLNLGALLTKSNRSADALPLLKRAVEIDPKSGKGQYELAKAAFNLEYLPEAQNAAEAAIRLDPDDSSYHYLLGRIYQKHGKRELATQQFKATEELLQRKKASSSISPQPTGASNSAPAAHADDAASASARPADVAELRKQAHATVQSGDYEKALSLLMKARTAYPEDPQVQYDFGMVALHMSLFSDAARAFTATLVLRRDDPNALYGLGRAQIGLTQYQEAREAFVRYLQLRPQDASAHYALGVALAALQLSSDARKQFETSIQQQPLQTESYFQLGLLDLEDKQLENATANFRHVLERDPRHAGALTGMGRVEFEKKEYAQAIESLRQAIAIDATLRQAHYYLGLSYARTGQKDDSAKELAVASQIEHEEAEKQRLGLRVVNAEQH